MTKILARKIALAKCLIKKNMEVPGSKGQTNKP